MNFLLRHVLCQQRRQAALETVTECQTSDKQHSGKLLVKPPGEQKQGLAVEGPWETQITALIFD